MSVQDRDIYEIDKNLSTRAPNHRPRVVTRAALAAGLVLSQWVAGCGGDSTTSAPPPTAPTVKAAAILDQPVDQSVPMGLTATYAVGATSSGLQFQWKKNGVAIAGATSSSYTTPPTAFADSGASFSVTVSNSAGSTDSTAAALTVTARAPLAGDLRFQQVDAPSTVNGWGDNGGLGTNLLAMDAQVYNQRIGTPLYVGATGDCVLPPSTIAGVGCSWLYSVFPVAASAGGTSLNAGYASDFSAYFQADVQSSAWPGLQMGTTSMTPVSGSSVITSLDLESANALFTLSWIQSTQETGFLANQFAVAPADLQATATQEGAAGRVITALSYDAGQVTGFSYGWQADAGTVYESQVVTSSPANGVAAAASLAAQGYIITASGRADDNGNLLLVGTRVQGDTVARPFTAAQGSGATAPMEQGYSIVAVIADITQPNPYTLLLER